MFSIPLDTLMPSRITWAIFLLSRYLLNRLSFLSIDFDPAGGFFYVLYAEFIQCIKLNTFTDAQSNSRLDAG